MSPAPQGSPPDDRLRVLLIDDGAHRVQLIREELVLQGHEVAITGTDIDGVVLDASNKFRYISLVKG